MTIVAVRSFQNSALPLQNARQLCIVFGRVGGEVCRPIVWISDGGQLEGVVVAQELTVGGRFKGTIHANRVTLGSSAVVEGEIFYRSLAIDANAWFAGLSRPEENLTLSWTTAHVNDVPSLLQHPFKSLNKKEDKMFRKSKGSSGRTPTTGTAVAKSSQCESCGVRYNRRFF